MHIKVIFNSDSIKPEYQTGWGLSFLIDGKVLFDAGEKGPLLMKNLDLMNEDLADLRAVVLSHEHWDHVDGLWHLLTRKPDIDVYVCPSFSTEFKERVSSFGAHVFEINGMREILPLMHVIGEFKFIYKEVPFSEQVMVLEAEHGIGIFTGCAHPGIISILEKVQEEFPDKALYFVGGGFHLRDATANEINNVIRIFRQKGVRRVGPTHCSGLDAERLFLEEYRDSFVSMKIGTVLEI